MKWFAASMGIIYGAAHLAYGIHSIVGGESAVGGDGEIWAEFKGGGAVAAGICYSLLGLAALAASALVIAGAIEV